MGQQTLRELHLNYYPDPVLHPSRLQSPCHCMLCLQWKVQETGVSARDWAEDMAEVYVGNW